ncbi:hypothetical protein HDU98_011195, partial [Podochytrium sp. JEL0797]
MAPENKNKKYILKAAQTVKSNAVQPKMQGILGFCPRNKEKQATTELMALLEEYGDKLYGDHQFDEPAVAAAPGAAPEESDEDEDPTVSIEDAFAKEVAGLKKPRSAKRFMWLNVGIECCLFVKCHASVDPTALVKFMLADLNDTKIQKTRYLQRILPAAETCLAFMDHITPMAKRLLPTYFSGEGMEPKKFSIVFARRNNTTIDRDSLIPPIAAIATETVQHTVSLTEPDICVIVEIFKGVCAMSVVENYYEFKKFNLESIHGKNVGNQQNKK